MLLKTKTTTNSPTMFVDFYPLQYSQITLNFKRIKIFFYSTLYLEDEKIFFISLLRKLFLITILKFDEDQVLVFQYFSANPLSDKIFENIFYQSLKKIIS